MPWQFIITIIFMVLAIACFLFSAAAPKVGKDEFGAPDPNFNPQKTLFIGGIALAVIMFIFMGFSSLTHAGSREIAIITSFDKFERVQGPGWEFQKPWTSAEKFSSRIQTNQFKRIKVKLASETEGAPSATAWVTGKLRWHIDKDTSSARAKDLWEKYKSFDSVQRDLVNSETATSVGEALGNYQPVPAQDGKNRRKIGTDIITKLKAALADDGIVIDSASVTDIDLDDEVDKRLRDAIAAQGKLATDKVELDRAEVARLIRVKRQQNVTSKSSTDDCLDLIRYAVEKGQAPSTWPNCGMANPPGLQTVGK